MLEHDSLVKTLQPEDSSKQTLLAPECEMVMAVQFARSNDPNDGTANISRATTAQEVIEAQLEAVKKLYRVYKVMIQALGFPMMLGVR